MKKTKLLIHLVFNRERHLLSSFLFVFLFSLMFSFVYSVQSYPLAESASHHQEMDRNCFIVQPNLSYNVIKANQFDLETYLSYGEEIYKESVQKSFYQDRVQSYDIGIMMDLPRESGMDQSTFSRKLYYVNQDYNVNNFGDFHVLSDNLNDQFCFWDSSLPLIDSALTTFVFYEGMSVPIQDKSRTMFLSDISFVCRSKQSFARIFSQAGDEVSPYFFFTIHLKDEFTIQDAKKLYVQSSYSDILNQDYSSCFNCYQDCQKSGQYYLEELLSDTLLLLLMIFVPVFLVSLFLSDGIHYRKKIDTLHALEALGFTKKHYILIQFLSALTASLLGFLAYSLLYLMTALISDSVFGFSFLNGILFLVPLCCLLLICLEKILVVFLSHRKTDNR